MCDSISFRRAVHSRLHLTPPPPPPLPLARAVTASPLAFSHLVARRTSRAHRTSRSIAARASRPSRAASTRTNLSRRREDLVSTTSPTRVRSRACARACVRARACARDSSNPRAASPCRSVVSRCRNARRDGTKTLIRHASFAHSRRAFVVRTASNARRVSRRASRAASSRVSPYASAPRLVPGAPARAVVVSSVSSSPSFPFASRASIVRDDVEDARGVVVVVEPVVVVVVVVVEPVVVRRPSLARRELANSRDESNRTEPNRTDARGTDPPLVHRS